MVRDVTTRWNSTYNMLEFAVQYCPAIDAMTAIRDLDLCKYELASSEWKITAELHDVLKVCLDFLVFYLFLTFSNRSSRTLSSFFLVEHPISPLSFLPWTTSTRCSPCLQTACTSFPLQYMLLSLLGKVLWTSTTIKPTSPKSIVSQWVRSFSILYFPFYQFWFL